MPDNVSLSTSDKTLLGIGAVAGVVPFFVSISSSSMSTVNGVVTSASHTDPIAIGGGALAILCGGGAAVLARKHGNQSRILAGLAVLALGGFQLARGFGLV